MCWYFQFPTNMSVRQITVKQAEKWLEKLKTQNAQSYKELSKSLRKYEQKSDDFDCYVKINHTLLPHTDLTKELNLYMQEANKFVINKPEEDKIKDFMAYVKKHHYSAFEKIIAMIQDLSKSKGQNALEISKMLRPRLSGIVEGDRELQKITEETLDLTGEQLISRKNLDYLKIVKQPDIDQIENTKPPPKPAPKPQPVDIYRNLDGDSVGRGAGSRYGKPFLIGPFANPSQEKNIIRQIQKMVEEPTFDYIMKVVKIYTLNIITRAEAFDLLAHIQAEQLYMDCLRDILDSRETQRRKGSVFRPLNDMNFNNCERASPSYVTMPTYYPTTSSAKPEWMKVLTNQNWVSVPYGSQENENFSVRNKNSNQINLLKAEDERYQFDLYMKRLTKALDLLNLVTDENSPKEESEREKIIEKVIGLGGLQMIYKNSHRDQKEELQFFLKTADLETCKIFKERVQFQVNELKNIKEIHAIKNWSEVANKNFFKALDLKGFEFKKNEKEKMKSSFFITELQERQKLMQNGGENKNGIIFEEKKEFFTVLNSFESSSRTEKCISREYPKIQTFDLKNEQTRHLYPMVIMSFENESICENIYSLLLFYIDAFSIAQPEKLKCKFFLQQFLVEFLGWKIPVKFSLSQHFDEEKFYAKINGSEDQVDLKSWMSQNKEESLMMIDEQQEERDEKKIKKMGLLTDEPSKYSYLPVKSGEKMVLYGSQHLYTLCRFIYALYERLIRMKEVAENQEKIDLFYMLLHSCVKTKESSKFQENLNILFGKSAYLFSTIYKLLDNLIKSLSAVANCPITSQSFKCSNEQSQDIYFVLLNRFCLTSNLTSNKLSRLVYHKEDKVVYFNYIDSYYKSDDIGKDVVKKRAEIAKGIEIYTVDSFGLTEKKKRKFNEVFENNELQYIFDGNTIKMFNHAENEDLMQYVGRKTIFSKTIKRELRRAYKMWGKSC